MLNHKTEKSFLQWKNSILNKLNFDGNNKSLLELKYNDNLKLLKKKKKDVESTIDNFIELQEIELSSDKPLSPDNIKKTDTQEINTGNLKKKVLEKEIFLLKGGIYESLQIN